MNNLLKINTNSQGTAEVELANIANFIFAYNLSGKNPEQLKNNYSYIYKIFAKFGLCDTKKNISGNIRIPLKFLKKLLKELQANPDKFNQKYVEVKQYCEKKPNYYSAKYCEKLLQEIKNYEQQQMQINANNNAKKFKKFIKNPSLSNFPRDIKCDEIFVEVIKNLLLKNCINFKYLFPYYENIFYMDLSNIFYINPENKTLLKFNKIYYKFDNPTNITELESELEISKVINFANDKLKNFAWNNTEVCFVKKENFQQIQILFTNQDQQQVNSNSKLNFTDLVQLNFKHKIANKFPKNDKHKICLFHKYINNTSPQQFYNDFAEIALNNILSQVDFNEKVIDFLQTQKLSKTFFNSMETRELYKEVIANLYNLQTMYNHLKGITTTDGIPNFLIDKIF